jgi:predicted methyltransferase
MSILNQVIKEEYAIYHGDCIEVAKGLPENSVDFSVFSPPFSSLYTYSNSDRDMGNSKNDKEFFAHFQFLIKELYRIIKPGRLVSFHCMNLPTSKVNDGYISVLKILEGISSKHFKKKDLFIIARFVFGRIQ